VLYEHEVNPKTKDDRLWYKQHRGENPHQAYESQKKTGLTKTDKKTVAGVSKKPAEKKAQN